MTHRLRRVSVIYLYALSLILGLCFAISCHKPNGDNHVKLRFSCEDDILTFDTVFTSIGSITRQFTVHNTSNQNITATIALAGGERSFYSINVNGVSGTYFKNVEIPKKDSIFIFVKVNIDPSDENNPYLVKDSIEFLTDMQKQDVKLLAYGQNANYIVADKESGYKVVAGEKETVKWTKDRPYVVYGWAVIDSTGTLIIDPGTRIYFHNNSGLWAYRYSNLEVNGTLDEPVLFRGDRLESWFDEDYAQWSRIWINEGAEVSINNAIISNAFVGVQIEPLPTNEGIINITSNTVKIQNTVIKNTRNSGVISRFLNVDMTNCVIANNGGYGLQLEGGKFTMKHLTVANYFMQAERKTPACYVSNKVLSVQAYEQLSPIETGAEFVNCIFTGNIETEVEVKEVKGAELEASFQNCLVKSKNSADFFIACLRNEDPKFEDVKKLDFRLQSSSPAIGKGKPNIDVLLDILGNPRGDLPDIGAYQY